MITLKNIDNISKKGFTDQFCICGKKCLVTKTTFIFSRSSFQCGNCGFIFQVVKYTTSNYNRPYKIKIIFDGKQCVYVSYDTQNSYEPYMLEAYEMKSPYKEKDVYDLSFLLEEYKNKSVFDIFLYINESLFENINILT